MDVGLKRINRILRHSKIGDRSIDIEILDIDGKKLNIKNQFDIEKHNPSYMNMRSNLSKKRIFLNKEDWNTHGYFEYD